MGKSLSKIPIENMIKDIDEKKEAYKEQALTLISKEELDLATKFLKANPRVSQFYSIFTYNRQIIQSLKQQQLYEVLKLEKENRNIEYIEPIIRYTQYDYVSEELQRSKEDGYDWVLREKASNKGKPLIHEFNTKPHKYPIYVLKDIENEIQYIRKISVEIEALCMVIVDWRKTAEIRKEIDE